MGETFYSIEEMENLRNLASYYELDGVETLYAVPLSYLCRVCNGAGVECWSDIKRKALTFALRRYETAVLIHDVDYSTQIGRHTADMRLLRNMRKIWKKDFGIFRWFRPSARIERRVIIPAVFAAVAIAGGSAYEAAGKEK